jgi:peptidyl-prolyl cis-trans isomerase D
VLTEFGYHLIKLVDMEDAKEPVFEDVKSRVEAEFREAEAEEMFVSLSSRLSEISYESPDLIDPSVELELSILTESDVNRFTDVGLGSNPAVQSVVFSDDVLLDRNNSELLEITPNHHVVVRITRYQPEEVMPIADVRTQIEETLSLEQAITIAEDQAKDMVAMLESGSIARFVADKYNLKWTVSSETSRNQLTFDREISTQAFTLARPAEGNKSVGYAVLSNGDAVVMSVTNVNNKTEKESESDLDRLAKVLGAQQGLSEYQEFRSSLNPGGLVETL